jgi:hypothetical protein
MSQNFTENVLATGASTNASAAMVTGADAATGVKQILAYNADSSAHPFTATIVHEGESLGDAGNIVLTDGIASIPATDMLFVRDHLDPEIEIGDGDAIQYTCDGTHITWYVIGA